MGDYTPPQDCRKNGVCGTSTRLTVTCTQLIVIYITYTYTTNASTIGLEWFQPYEL